MATNDNGNHIEITSLVADYDHGSVERIASIIFIPGATDDVLVVKDGSDTGPTVMYVKCADTYDQRVKYFYGQALQPYIDFSECTLSTGHKILIARWPNRR